MRPAHAHRSGDRGNRLASRIPIQEVPLLLRQSRERRIHGLAQQVLDRQDLPVRMPRIALTRLGAHAGVVGQGRLAQAHGVARWRRHVSTSRAHWSKDRRPGRADARLTVAALVMAQASRWACGLATQDSLLRRRRIGAGRRRAGTADHPTTPSSWLLSVWITMARPLRPRCGPAANVVPVALAVGWRPVDSRDGRGRSARHCDVVSSRNNIQAEACRADLRHYWPCLDRDHAQWAE